MRNQGRGHCVSTEIRSMLPANARREGPALGEDPMIRSKLAAIALAIAAALTISSELSAQDSQNYQHHHYKLVDLGALGEPVSYPLPQDHHAILWKNGGTKIREIDLGVLPGDSCSRAYWVNSRGQVVGNSENKKLCDQSGEHAFLWEEGRMLDLDTLIPPGWSLKLVKAFAITDRGEIVGAGVPPGCPRSQDASCGHAYVLIPCDQDRPETSDSAAELSTTQTQLAEKHQADDVAMAPDAVDRLAETLALNGEANSSLQAAWGRPSRRRRCLPAGGECSDPLLPRCCPGLTCTFEGMRAHCLKNPF